MISRENSENLTISAEEIKETVERIATDIVLRYGNSNPTLIGTMISGGPFAIAVHNALEARNFRHRLTWIGSRKTASPEKGEVIMYDPPSYHLLHKQRVILLDALAETGRTLLLLGNYIAKARPRSIEVGALVVKLAQLPDWLRESLCGFMIPPETSIVVGFGLDYNSNHRDEDGIRLLREEEKIEPEPVAG